MQQDRLVPPALPEPLDPLVQLELLAPQARRVLLESPALLDLPVRLALPARLVQREPLVLLVLLELLVRQDRLGLLV